MFHIGPVVVESGLVLAPLSGITDSPTRRIARRHGAGAVVTELVSAEGLVRGSVPTRELTRFHEEERPIGIQIFGGKPEVMAEAARIVAELRPDFIDINMGCPAPRVCNTGGGSALLADPARVEAVARAVVRAVDLPVTAKIRLGVRRDSLTCFEVVAALENAGIKLVFVHGRTRDQKYGGTADWDVIAGIVRKTALPVVGNGDVSDAAEARSRLRQSGCAGIMIGRAAMGNPWLFSDRVPGVGELVAQVREHLGMMLDYYGPRGLILMRKHMARYFHDFHGASKIRSRLVIAQTVAEIESILGEIEDTGQRAGS